MRLSARPNLPYRPAVLTCAVVVALALGLPPAAAASPAPAATPLQQVARALGTPAAGLTVVGDVGAITRLGAAAGHPFARPHGVTARTAPVIAARAFLQAHGDLLGAAATTSGARTESTEAGRVVTLTQTVGGVPVLGGQVSISLTTDNRVESLTTHTTADTGSSTPSDTFPRSAAAALAVADTAAADGVAASTLHVAQSVAAFYDPALLGVPGGAAGRRVWSVTVTSPTRLDIRRSVLVDQDGGAVALGYDETELAESRVVCDEADQVGDYTCPSVTAPVKASEAVPPPAGSDADVVAAYTNIGGVYAFYKGVLGRDGIDGKGGAIAATVHVCEDSDDCPMANSFWDGQQLVFGDGFPEADDVVAHEMTHGVTDATSGLYYLYQSGAIDESMSDVMGELYDQWDGTGKDGDGTGGANGTIDYRWMIGEDLPASEGVLRDMRNPTVAPAGVPTPNFTPQPDSMTSPLYGAAVDPKTGEPIDSGEVHLNSGVGNKAAELIVDGGVLNGVTVHGLGGAVAATRGPAIIKAAHLYYLTDQMLASGSDYADLAATLSQACAEIVGKHLADGHGGYDVMSKADCASVREAVAATRMTTDPRHGSAPDAPTCTKGTPQSFGFKDSFEPPAASQWKAGIGWYDPQTRDRASDNLGYGTSGTHELYASDGDTARDSTATMRKTYQVPVGKSSYLRFSQAYLLDYEPAGDGEPALYFDGGRVEFSRNGGPWQSAEPLFDFGGYSGEITGYNEDKEAYSFRGFGGDSHGYRSARINLTSLAGSTVRFRFRLTTDSFGSSLGWFIDDVGFYSCGAKPSAVKASVVRTSTVATVVWAPPVDRGTSPITRYVVTVADRTLGRTLSQTSVRPSVHMFDTVAFAGHRYTFTVTAYNKSGRGVTTITSG